MSEGMTFRETMQGPVSLAATDPETGAAAGDAATLAIHCQITIDDVDRFIADPEHTAMIAGSIDFAPFGGSLPVRQGIFNLFSPGGPGERIMEYRLGFEAAGKPYLLDGRKHAHDDPGFDVWKDTTTLYTVLYEGEDDSGTIAGAGVLGLGVEELAKMVGTMRSTSGGIEPLAKFGKLFLGSLWETYGASKLGGGS